MARRKFGFDVGIGDKRSTYLPSLMIDALRSEAGRQGRSMSWLVERAWRTACAGIGSMHEIPPTISKKGGEKLSLYLHRRSADEITSEADRLGVRSGPVVALAWSLAESRIKALPAEPHGAGEEES